MDRSKEIVEALVQEVTAKAKLNKAVVEYYDLDRVHFKIEEQGYAIRMWNIHQVGKKVFIRWTLFKLIDNHGEEICDGEFTWVDNMRTATLRNIVNGVEVKVHATTEHPDSSYGKAVWVDDDNNAYCQVDMPNPFYEIIED